MGRVTATRQRETLASLRELAEHLDAFGERLDPAIAPAEVSAALREAGRLRAGVDHLAAVLKSLPLRACAHCGTAMNGRTDRAYCGGTCRQRARRARLSDA